MFKNVASQKLVVFAFDATANTPKTGDAANITAYVSKDYGAVTVLGDTSATEMDSTNAKGYYLFDLAQAETNADTLLFSAKSSTANIVVIGVPATVFTTPANFTSQSIDGNGRLDVIKVAGTTQTARDLGASVLLSVGTGTGQVNLSSGKVPATLASTDVTGNVAADLQTIKTQTVTCAGGVTVPAATLASTTNITAGTITTATNLTNAPTAGDFTATMKTSLNAATPASVQNISAQTGDSYSRLGAPAGASVSADVAAIKSDTGTILTDVNSGAGAIYTRIGAPAGASIAADIAAVNAKTTNLPSSPAATGDAMTLTAPYDFAKGTVAVTESYAADGAAPTPIQALLLIQQALSEFVISGTTYQIKKIDGLTNAAALTLNDATNPTGATRSA